MLDLPSATLLLTVLCILWFQLAARRILELCDNLGFQLHRLIPGFFEEKTRRLLQTDGLFLRVRAV
jgi:hypothetical protein